MPVVGRLAWESFRGACRAWFVLPVVAAGLLVIRSGMGLVLAAAPVAPVTVVAGTAAPARFAGATGSVANAVPSGQASSEVPLPAFGGTLDISADSLDVDTKGERATLTGKVVLTKGNDLSLKCPKLEARYEATGPHVNWARGSGGVIAEVKGVHGEAPEFELDLVRQRLVLRGGVRLSRAGGWVVADGAEIDLATARVTMSRVKASLPVGTPSSLPPRSAWSAAPPTAKP